MKLLKSCAPGFARPFPGETWAPCYLSVSVSWPIGHWCIFARLRVWSGTDCEHYIGGALCYPVRKSELITPVLHATFTELSEAAAYPFARLYAVSCGTCVGA